VTVLFIRSSGTHLDSKNTSIFQQIDKALTYLVITASSSVQLASNIAPNNFGQFSFVSSMDVFITVQNFESATFPQICYSIQSYIAQDSELVAD